jgi:acyl transferase domain-containing protein
MEADNSYDIAIVGVAGCFPKAKNIGEFWRNLEDGVEGISFFSDGELEISLAPSESSNPAYVKAGGVLEEIEMFDAAFFNMSAREAEWMDPQQRLFLEYAWSAIENAGYNVQTLPQPVAVYAGANTNFYLLARLDQLASGLGGNLFGLLLANEKDFLATRVSYKFNLKGESITIQTSCSTSLVAVHLACQSLLSEQCNMALAGGVSVRVPQKTGYLYEEGMISSPDGHCRAFDHRAQGTLPGNGLGIVVLKRLADALKDGDYIHAVIKGSAVNNDGHTKAGYTAPGVEGQSDVIAKALALADVEAETIGFVEAHGTGTPLGDPIEVEALRRAFRRQTDRTQFCALGSVKTNIGHLDNAAGVTGLIKTVLALQHKVIPPSLHFEKPNPAIDLESSPFYVNSKAVAWPASAHPRRAGVSSFGIGGTNAHVILEEAPEIESGATTRPFQIVTLSALTKTAVESMTQQLAAHLEEHPRLLLADVAFTRNAGRQAFNHRQSFIVRSREELLENLRPPLPASKGLANATVRTPQVVFMFPGQGTQHVDMARELYDIEPTFHQHVDSCSQLLKNSLGMDLTDLVYPPAEKAEESGRLLMQPRFALPALFTIEYALAQLLMSWNVKPRAMIGHSFGEYVAACLSGVFSLEDALRLTVERGRLMQTLPPGAMSAVRLPEAALRSLLTSQLSIAAVNTKTTCVVSGPPDEVAELEQSLDEKHIVHRPLNVAFAYHSAMIEPLIEGFKKLVQGTTLHAPCIPFISSLTGTWITEQEATTPSYWANQMRHAVRFAGGLDTLSAGSPFVLVEVGPNQTLSLLAKQHLGREAAIVSSLRSAQFSASEAGALVHAVGELWCAGLEVDWVEFYRHERRQRQPLPNYPFERQRYWIETIAAAMDHTAAPARVEIESSMGQPAELVASPDGQPTSQAKHEVERSRLQHEYVAPRSEMETMLTEIWNDVLGLEGIGVHDNFFSLGGDSLVATQVLSRVRQASSTDLPLSEVLIHLTIAELAEALQRHGREGEQMQPVAGLELQTSPRNQQLQLSFAQERLWLAHKLVPDSPMYNLPAVVRLSGPLNTKALERSLNQIRQRHEVLRTSFPFVNGRPVLAIASSCEVSLEAIDCSAWPEAEREERARQMISVEAQRAFDLEHDWMFRATLLRLSQEDHIFVMTLHHIVSDAWSMNILIGELGALYEASAHDRPSPLPELPIQYADFAQWQRRLLQGVSLDSLLIYWKQTMAGAPLLTQLRTDRPRPSRQTFNGARQSISLSTELSQSLKALSRSEGVTFYTLLLAAFKTRRAGYYTNAVSFRWLVPTNQTKRRPTFSFWLRRHRIWMGSSQRLAG